MVIDWEHQEDEAEEKIPMPKYNFFTSSDGTVFVESTNWCMKYFASEKLMDDEVRKFLDKYPEREESFAEDFEEWCSYSPEKRRKLKKKAFKEERKNKMKGCIMDMFITAPSHTHSISLDTLPCQVDHCVPYNQNQEGNNPMCNYDNAATIEREQRKFLQSALYTVRDKFYTDFHKHFHMEPVGPNTVKEMVEWIKSDNFEVIKDRDNWSTYDFFQALKWVDKANSPDKDGYDAAVEKMQKAYKDAERVIRIKSPEAGLDALTAFESATFH